MPRRNLVLLLAAACAAASFAAPPPQCGAGNRLPRTGAPCTSDAHCAMLLRITLTSADACCAKCATVAACNAWTYHVNSRTKKAVCLCKTQDIRAVGTTSAAATSGYLAAAPGPAPAPTPAPAPAPANAKNLLYIVVDDLRNELGFTNGRRGLVTPHMDALAARSMVFTRAYVQQGVCSPSRNSFLSGRRPDTTKIWNFKDSFRTFLGDDVSSWPGAFKKAGYISTGMGKVYHPNHPKNDDGALSWSLDWAPYMHPKGFAKKISTAPDSTFQVRHCQCCVLVFVDTVCSSLLILCVSLC